MRRVPRNRPLTTPPIDHPHAEELAEIGSILRAHPEIAAWVQGELLRPGVSPDIGRDGMTGDQALRALVVKMLKGYSYEDLAFHLADSATYRRFCGYGAVGFGKTPKKSALNKNIKRISARVIEWINRVVLGVAKEDGIEDGRKARIDCTVVETNIHEPSDSEQLWDTVRVLARLLARAEEAFGIRFHNRTRAAKRANYAIRTAKPKKRRKLYRRLLEATQETIEYALGAAMKLEQLRHSLGGMGSLQAESLRQEMLKFSELGSRVVDQARRRVLLGEKVPAEEKVLSIFEPHTDVILKGGRGPEYGHKICVNAGASGMVADCVILAGNPADSTLATEMVERHTVIYGKAPHDVVFDGAFAAKKNLADIKALDGTDTLNWPHLRGK